jgi:hypothetical protein
MSPAVWDMPRTLRTVKLDLGQRYEARNGFTTFPGRLGQENPDISKTSWCRALRIRSLSTLTITALMAIQMATTVFVGVQSVLTDLDLYQQHGHHHCPL